MVLVAASRLVPCLADQPPVWAHDPAWRAGARDALAAQNSLNNSQRRAVAQAMVRSTTLIQVSWQQ
jgi:hypothetical protein